MIENGQKWSKMVKNSENGKIVGGTLGFFTVFQKTSIFDFLFLSFITVTIILRKWTKNKMRFVTSYAVRKKWKKQGKKQQNRYFFQHEFTTLSKIDTFFLENIKNVVFSF